MAVNQVVAGLFSNPSVQKKASELLGLFTKTAAGVETKEGLDLATNFLQQFNERGSELRECLKARVSALQGSLNGEAETEQKELLEKLVSVLEKGEVTPDKEDLQRLIEIVRELDNQRSFTFTISPSVEEEHVTRVTTEGQKNPTDAPAKDPKTAEGESLGAERIKEQEDKIKKLEEALSKQKASGNRFAVSESSTIENDVEALKEAAFGIITKELTRPNTWWGLGWDMFGPGDAPKDPNELPGYLAKKLFGEDCKKFEDCLTNHLKYMKGEIADKPDVSQYGLNSIQSKAFKAIKGSLFISKYIPQNIRRILGRMGMFINPILGFLSKVPILGNFLVWFFPPFKEFVIDNLVFHEDKVSVMQAISSKYKAPSV